MARAKSSFCWSLSLFSVTKTSLIQDMLLNIGVPNLRPAAVSDPYGSAIWLLETFWHAQFKRLKRIKWDKQLWSSISQMYVRYMLLECFNTSASAFAAPLLIWLCPAHMLLWLSRYRHQLKAFLKRRMQKKMLRVGEPRTNLLEKFHKSFTDLLAR